MVFISLMIAMSVGNMPGQGPDTPNPLVGKTITEPAMVGARLLELMREGIEVKEPNVGFHKRAGRPSLFDGSYDWHSCVIAHWCLLVAARTQSDDDLKDWITSRLDEVGLAQEVELLTDRKTSRLPTYPYDEAWFLMLLSERAKHPNPPALIGEWRAQFEERLLSALEARPFPERGERGFSGAYDSWLNSYLLLLWSEPTSEGVRARLRALRELKLEPNRDALTATSTVHGYNFLWLPAILGLVDRELSAERTSYDPGPPAKLPDEVVVATVHPLGVFITRTWPDALDAGRGDERARARYHEHLTHFLAREDLWAGEFDACSHWLPQYLWIGLWLAEGRP